MSLEPVFKEDCYFPPEIVQKIFVNADRPSLRNLRLVNWDFKAMADPVLFQTVYVHSHDSSLEKAISILEDHGLKSLLKELVCEGDIFMWLHGYLKHTGEDAGVIRDILKIWNKATQSIKLPLSDFKSMMIQCLTIHDNFHLHALPDNMSHDSILQGSNIPEAMIQCGKFIWLILDLADQCPESIQVTYRDLTNWEDRALTVKIIYTIVKAYEAYEAIQNKEIASLEAQIGKTTPCETSAKPRNQ